ncbi:MAG: diaminopimelate epimerase [Clostridia bacterium]|nr:diaminopimelate epimerase [Clostridia bacterium]
MKFVKMHGIGNDYIYADCIAENKIDDPARLAIRISDRHKGVGSDGLILISKGEKAEFRMDIFNADGSQAQMCGNGIRCVGKYLFDRGYVQGRKVDIETLGGIKTLKLIVRGGKCAGAEVDMGEPALEKEKIPVLTDGENMIEKEMTVAGKKYKVTCVSMGNPHAVIFLDEDEEGETDLDKIDLEKIGPKFEHDKIFPERTNTEFAEVADRRHLKMRVWERGSGETMACGTGACAVAVAAAVTGRADRETTIALRGGDLKIRWDEKTNHVFMTGPAEEICTLEYEI